MKQQHSTTATSSHLNAQGEVNLGDLAQALLHHWKLLLIAPILGGSLGFAGSSLITPTFIATTTFLPPQQPQSAAASALASLGSLAGLAGGGGGIKTSGDQYVALLQSVTVSDRVIDQFKLMDVYQVEFRTDARKILAAQTQISLGKKDGLIRVTAEDTDPRRAANIANQYVAELRTLNAKLALTEAQQRRAFFEKQWQESKLKLRDAQISLEQSGFSAGALRAEPKSTAEAFARAKAELSAAEIKLRALRTTLADTTPEVQTLSNTIQALRQRLSNQEVNLDHSNDKQADYVGRYREFKYQETLFELMAKQYELAKVDEGREGALVQVVDLAEPAEKKHQPKRFMITLRSALGAGLAMCLWLLWRRWSGRHKLN